MNSFPRLITEMTFDGVERLLKDTWSNTMELRNEAMKSKHFDQSEATLFVSGLIRETFNLLQKKKENTYTELSETMLIPEKNMAEWKLYVGRMMRHSLMSFQIDLLMDQDALKNVVNGSLSSGTREQQEWALRNVEVTDFVRSLFRFLWQTIWTIEDAVLSFDLSNRNHFLPSKMICLSKIDKISQKELDSMNLVAVLAPSITQPSCPGFLFPGCGVFERPQRSEGAPNDDDTLYESE
eukprot:TRINITY_DN7893_c0_g1_i1.p1 TRINITY_DN7893_c0_g1~~TRINITY_DN7893_c0_g1_i1.p1  ORF type:complete len:238 (+),score=94.67 TRINITY_DN7893_c0_g1_i1:135-848(+)